MKGAWVPAGHGIAVATLNSKGKTTLYLFKLLLSFLKNETIHVGICEYSIWK